MTEHQIADRAKRHGLRIFKLKPIVQDTYLLINTEQKKIAGKFPMTLEQVETFLDALDTPGTEE